MFSDKYLLSLDILPRWSFLFLVYGTLMLILGVTLVTMGGFSLVVAGFFAALSGVGSYFAFVSLLNIVILNNRVMLMVRMGNK